MTFPLNVLHYMFSVNRRDRIVAHCLNFDLVATADKIEEAQRRLDVLVRFHIVSFLSTNGASGLNGHAPKEFWEDYTTALRERRIRPARTLRISVPDAAPMKLRDGDLEVVAADAIPVAA